MNKLPAIDRYIARLIFFPMLGSLVLASMLLILEKMVRLFEFVSVEGGPVRIVWQMLANLIPEYLALGIPIGLMLGILLAFRKLATTSELDVLKGVGMSFGRLMRVPFAYAVLLAALNLTVVGFIQPYARYAYEGLQFELRSGALGASIKVGEFTKLGDRMTLRIEESYDDGKSLRGIFVRGDNRDGQRVSATAARGQFLATDDPNTIILRLSQGVLIHESPKFAVPRVLTFDNHDLPIPLPKIEAFRLRGGADREMTIPELFVAGKDRSQSEQTRLESRANFHFRIVEVLSMFLIPLIAVALAIPPKRSTSSLGVFLSIVLLVTQHKINQYAEDMGARGVVDPVIALWVPFLLFAALAIWMYYVVAHVPGGQPIGALERVAAKTAQKIRGLMTMFQRKPRGVESLT